MGLSRQSVQRLADALVEDGLCSFLENPEHQRAKLLAPTKQGRNAIEQIHPIQVAFTNRLSEVVGESALRSASRTIDALLAGLDTPAGQIPKR